MSGRRAARGGGVQADRWRRVRELLEAVVGLDAAERDRVLARECGDDAALRREVEELLAEDEPAAESMEPPPPSALSDLLPNEPASDLTGTRVGVYRVTRRLASGGMGTVYRAVRDDEHFTKQVALKVIKRGMDSEEILERFQRERQVLAHLEHPGIARLIDGGLTDDGRSYLVMEFVEGLSIDRYCDENRLSTRERVELFLQVCDAVQYAHASLVVHRDLKPSNVLVTPAGAPKLLDFGIAKVIDPASAAEAELTRAAAQLMTPEYASPEQVRGRSVTTASDVYSLGVLLYQLLSGRLPYELATGSLLDIERVVCEEQPARPSTVITRSPKTPPSDAVSPATAEELGRLRASTPQRLRKALAGDLDTIILMALRKEPQRRYASAGALAEDLRRYLDGRPVAARPETFTYLAGKFVRRNRLLVASAAAVFAALLIGLVTTYAQFERANAGWAEAEREGKLASEALAESQQLARDLADEKGIADGLRAQAEERLVEVQELAERLEREREVAQRRFEDVRLFATSLVFDVYESLEDVEGATYARSRVLELGLEHLDRLAADLRSGVDLDAEEERRLWSELIEGYRRFGDVLGALNQRNLGRSEAAFESYRKALDLARELVAQEGSGARQAYLLAQVCLALSGPLREARSGDEWRALLEEAIDALASWTDEGEQLSLMRTTLADAHMSLGRGLLAGGRPGEAGEHFARSTEIRRLLLEVEPGNERLQVSLALALTDEADLLAKTGDPHSAKERCERALDLLEGPAGSSSASSLAGRTYLQLHGMMGRILGALGRFEDALLHHEVAREGFRAQVDADARDVRARRDLGIVLLMLGSALTQLEREEEALEVHREQVEIARELYRLDPRSRLSRKDLATAQVQLADVEMRLGNLVEASEASSAACEHLEALHASDGEDFDAAWRLWIAHGTHGQVLLSAAGQEGASSESRARTLERARARFEQGLDVLRSMELGGAHAAERDRRVADFQRDIARCGELLSELRGLDG